MKKIILIIAAVMLTANYSNAQNNSPDSRSKFQFGVKAGLNLSNVFDERGQDFVADPKIGFATGGFVSIPVWKYLGVQPGLLFSQKGYRSTGTFFDSYYRYTRTLNYIDMPLLASFKPFELLTLVAGPQISFLVSQRDVFKGGSLTIDEQQEFKNDNIRRNVMCFLAGFDINLDHIVLGARAGWDIQNNNGDGTSVNPRYKNVWYQATVGFRFY
jgi:hypothetical protein